MASQGRRGTFSKAKSFRRTGFSLESHSSPEGGRNHQWTPEKPAPGSVEEEEAKTPVFLGADGTLYNKYYIAIKIIGIDDPPKMTAQTFVPPSSKEATKNSFNANDPVYTSFPEVGGYDNYFDYEQAVMDWKANVQANLGAIQPPRAMGRTYSRPRIVERDRLVRKNSEASNDDSLSFDSSERKNSEDMGPSELDEPYAVSNSPTLEGKSVLDVHSSSGSVNNNNNNATNVVINSKDGASRSRSGSDTSTGSFDGSGPIDGSSPIDGSPSSGSLTGLVLANGTRSRSNSSTYFDHRMARSNSLSPKQSLASRHLLGESGDFKMARGASMMGLGMDEDRWNMARDPWDAQLVLVEPSPELYNTFEEYEYAMKNWAIETILKTSVLPPHSTQLVQLPAKDSRPSAESGSESAGSKQSRHENGQLGGGNHRGYHIDEWRFRSGLFEVRSEEEMLNASHCDGRARLFAETYARDRMALIELKQGSQVWRKMEGDIKINIADIFDRWYRKKSNIHRQSLISYRGGVWSNHLLMPNIPNGWKESLTRRASLLPPLPIKALRRLDINSEADGKKVEHNIPAPDMPLDLTKLVSASMNLQYILSFFGAAGSSSPFAPHMHITADDTRAYVRTARAHDRRLAHALRYEEFYSWHRLGPISASSSEVASQLNSQKQDIEAILIQAPFDSSSIYALLNSSMVYLDKFQECFDIDSLPRMYAPPLPPLIVVPTTPAPGTSNTTPTTPGTPLPTGGTPVKGAQFGTPTSPAFKELLGSPPSRSGSVSNFSFPISPAGGKSILSPSSQSSYLSSGIESPRPNNPILTQSPRDRTAASNLGGSFGSGGSSNNIGSAINNNNNNSTSSPPSNPYAAHFYSYITTNTFPEMLTAFEKVASPLAHAKLSSLIMACLGSDKGSLLVENIMTSKDIYSLYRIAQGMSFFDAVPLDLYPYPVHLNLVMMPSIAKGSTTEVVRLVFMYYYLNIIQERIQFYNSHPVVISCISSSKRNIGDALVVQITNDKELLSKIFRALSRKSSTISHCFLFVLVQMTRMTEHPQIISFLKTQELLLPHIRDLCHSKFLHSQFAAKRLFAILQEDGWKDFLYTEYTNDKDALITDLLQSTEKGSNSLLSELVFNMCISTLEGMTSSGAAMQSVGFLLKEELFYKIYNAIVKSKKFDQNVENLAKLFAHMCKTSVRFSMVKKNDHIKVSKKSAIETEIQISPTFMFELLAFVVIPQVPSDKTLVKNYMLEGLRHLMKPVELFEILKKEATLYNKLLIASCRDGRNAEFNRNSWRLFFQIIRFHPGHIEYLEKNKYLAQFVDIINTNAGGVVLSNSLHYITKLFSLVLYENRRSNLWKGSPRPDPKHTEKDVKTLRDFFIERHMFIKVHMVYRRYMESFPGRPFIQLCNLYQAISTLTICLKLYKDTTKTLDYKEGFLKISKWFKDDSVPF
eukprot:gene2516-2875_t